ncbi:hypothetical protein [Clostridium pasteurianum]|nr:hypothetical protein [Clostridium pasteurianum]
MPLKINKNLKEIKYCQILNQGRLGYEEDIYYIEKYYKLVMSTGI